MIPQAAWNSVRSGLPAILALLAWAAMSPSQADASCGDYVMVGGRHASHEHQPQSFDHGKQGPGIPRCHGPMCSDNSIPPAAPSSKIEVSVERWAIPGSEAFDLLPSHSSWLADVRDVPRDGYGLSILRPPR
jgi:hypothetical protein